MCGQCRNRPEIIYVCLHCHTSGITAYIGGNPRLYKYANAAPLYLQSLPFISTPPRCYTNKAVFRICRYIASVRTFGQYPTINHTAWLEDASTQRIVVAMAANAPANAHTNRTGQRHRWAGCLSAIGLYDCYHLLSNVTQRTMGLYSYGKTAF